MKWSWDKKYTKIAQYVILTAITIYALMFVVDFLVFVLTDFDGIMQGTRNFIGKMFNIFMPLIIALVMAYLLDPVVEFFQNKYDEYVISKYRIPEKIEESKQKKFGSEPDYSEPKQFRQRTAGTVITFVVVVGVVYFLISLVISAVLSSSTPTEQSQSIVVVAQNYIVKATEDFNRIYSSFENQMKNLGLYEYFESVLGKLNDVLESLFGALGNFVANIVGVIIATTSSLLTFFLGAVLGFYVLRDKAEFKYKTLGFMDVILPDKVSLGTKHFFSDVNGIFSGYIRGQLTDASIMAIMLSVALSVVGVPFAVFIGIISGFSNLIPYVGAIVAFVLAIIAALSTGSIQTAILAAIVILVIQQIDSLIIVPRVVGSSVELSPFLVILSLSVAGTAFGIWGMVFAVPFTATLKIFITRFMDRQKETKSFKNIFSKLKSE